jgi:hypothetical protein
MKGQNITSSLQIRALCQSGHTFPLCHPQGPLDEDSTSLRALPRDRNATCQEQTPQDSDQRSRGSYSRRWLSPLTQRKQTRTASFSPFWALLVNNVVCNLGDVCLPVHDLHRLIVRKRIPARDVRLGKSKQGRPQCKRAFPGYLNGVQFVRLQNSSLDSRSAKELFQVAKLLG